MARENGTVGEKDAASDAKVWEIVAHIRRIKDSNFPDEGIIKVLVEDLKTRYNFTWDVEGDKGHYNDSDVIYNGDRQVINQEPSKPDEDGRQHEEGGYWEDGGWVSTDPYNDGAKIRRDNPTPEDLAYATSNVIQPREPGAQAAAPVHPNDLPDDVDDYFTNQDARTYWNNRKKEGKIRRLRMLLFRAGYYNTGTGAEGIDADIDFGDDITGADIDALARAMGDANVADPSSGPKGELRGLEEFLIDKKNDMHTDLTMKARLRSQMLAMAERYGLPPTAAEQSMDDLFSGNVTTKDLDLRMRNRAKALYPGWATQLDGGMSMAEIASPYRQAAASVLGIPNMSFSDPLMQSALNRQSKDGTPGYMTLDQFNRALRRDSRWEYTEDAHQYYGSLQNTIMETFGM